MSIFLSKYNNTDGKLADGRRCDDDSQCDHKFIVCADHPNGSLTNIRHCGIGNYTTETIPDRHQINFRNTRINNNPKYLNFREWQGGAILKVQVMDSDGNKDDLVDLLSTNVSIAASVSRNSAETRDFKIQNRTRLDVIIAVHCDDEWFGLQCNHQNYIKNNTSNDMADKIGHGEEYNNTIIMSPINEICNKSWYGSNCDVFCQRSTGENGNYECGSDGNKICHGAWTGENCTVNIHQSEIERHRLALMITSALLGVSLLVIFIIATVCIHRCLRAKMEKVEGVQVEKMEDDGTYNYIDLTTMHFA